MLPRLYYFSVSEMLSVGSVDSVGIRSGRQGERSQNRAPKTDPDKTAVFFSHKQV